MTLVSEMSLGMFFYFLFFVIDFEINGKEVAVDCIELEFLFME